MTTMKIKIPEKWDKYLEQYIKNGWAESKEEVLKEALIRFLESHKEEIIESHLTKDVEWGLSR
jgi:Arc/MetJ-type ribon-helix-helix transcriptional regulator